MKLETRLINAVSSTWQTNNRITAFLVEHIPEELWPKKVPGYQQKTIRMIAGHLHNTRCSWIKKVGKKFDVNFPEQVDRYHVSQQELITALNVSSGEIQKLFQIGIELNNTLPKFSLGAVHFVNYPIAHEAHHRGQIIMVARQLGYKLPQKVIDGVWKWPTRSKEKLYPVVDHEKLN